MLGVTVIQNRTRYTTEGATFLISHAIIYVYFGSLAHFFTPSGIPEPEKKEISSEKETKETEEQGEEGEPQTPSENPFEDAHFQKETQPEEDVSIPAPLEMESQIPRGENVELAEVDFGTSNEEPMKQETSLDSAFENQNFGFDEDPNTFPNFENNNTATIGEVKNEETNTSMKIAEVHDEGFNEEFE